MQILEDIKNVYLAQGSTRYGENVTQLEHALQTAQLAIEDGYDDEFVAACFLHDIGHLHYAEGLAQKNIDGEHEELGANYLSSAFSENVTEPIRLHVAAKRYLCATEPEYHDTLSNASKHSLKLQGGAFTAQEVQECEKNSLFEKAVKLRIYDDRGKIIDLKVISFDEILVLLKRITTT